MKIMASGPLTSWQTDGETMETVIVFIFLGSKITADGDCSHEIKRCLLLGRKARTNLDSILKNRDITLPTKVHVVKAMFFPVVMYRCESWTLKKAERLRKDASKQSNKKVSAVSPLSKIDQGSKFSNSFLTKTLESLLDSKEIKPVHPKGNKS